MTKPTHTSHGKWSEPGVPHRGWTCVMVDDLGEPAQLCEMCESVEIRYVHYMEHPSYGETLGVGCVCAEHMEDDYVSPRAREKRLKSRVRRRKTWSARRWSRSTTGNFYLNAEGFNLVVFPKTDAKGEQWELRVTHRLSGASQKGRRRYVSVEEAKKAGLDALMWAKDHLPK